MFLSVSYLENRQKDSPFSGELMRIVEGTDNLVAFDFYAVHIF